MYAGCQQRNGEYWKQEKVEERIITRVVGEILRGCLGHDEGFLSANSNSSSHVQTATSEGWRRVPMKSEIPAGRLPSERSLTSKKGLPENGKAFSLACESVLLANFTFDHTDTRAEIPPMGAGVARVRTTVTGRDIAEVGRESKVAIDGRQLCSGRNVEAAG